MLCFIPEATKKDKQLPPHYAQGKQHIAFEVEKSECISTKTGFLEKGLSITHTQEWKNGLESFYFEDPFNYVLEVVPKVIWE